MRFVHSTRKVSSTRCTDLRYYFLPQSLYRILCPLVAKRTNTLLTTFVVNVRRLFPSFSQPQHPVSRVRRMRGEEGLVTLDSFSWMLPEYWQHQSDCEFLIIALPSVLVTWSVLFKREREWICGLHLLDIANWTAQMTHICFLQRHRTAGETL